MINDPPVLLVTRKLPDAVESLIESRFDPRLNGDDLPYEGIELAQFADQADAMVVCPGDDVNRAVIEALDESVRLIATYSVGFEHLDLEAAKEHGVTVTHTPNAVTAATADMCLLLMLGAARRAHEGDLLLRSGDWTGWTPTQLLGWDISDKRLGILGMGRIGQAVAQRARGFDMEIHYHCRRRLPADKEKGARFHPTVDGLLAVSDVLSIHLPLNAETRHVLNASRIALLPEQAIVVNTARGGVVHDEALIAALKSGRLAAAGLDVFDGEPRINPGYLSLKNVFLQPHQGTSTHEARLAMGQRLMDNLTAFFDGRVPPDLLV